MLLADALDDYLFESRKLSPTTRRWYTQKLGTFQQWCHNHGLTMMDQITTREVRRFLDSLDGVIDPRKGTRITAQTQHGYTQVVKQWLRWCGARRLLRPRSLRPREVAEGRATCVQDAEPRAHCRALCGLCA